MKNIALGSIMLVLLLMLSGCQQTATLAENSRTAADTEGFVEPEPSNSVKYSLPVREYMYYRTQAVIHNDIQILWDQYPALKDGMERERGVNVEKDELESLNEGFDLLDANFNLESYEPIKVKTINDHEVIVLVHGSIAYLRSDFDESGGEYLIKIFLKYQDHHWKVVKTDEYTQPEYKEWLEEKEQRESLAQRIL